jgi:dTDP-4-amino-4,6-dideoxygalactose transaminase
VSTANAFALRGADIVFADAIAETMTIDTEDAERKISEKTKAIVAVHYGGYGAEVMRLREICDKRNILLIEDAAHSIGAGIHGRMQGTVGHLGCISFHETKNIQCGEGGLLLVNDIRLFQPAELVFEKGTNRAAFLRGEVPGYQWQRPGSSFSMSNLTAAMLLAQLQETEGVNYRRGELWMHYWETFGSISSFENFFSLPPVPHNFDEFNAHIFFIKGRTPEISSRIHNLLNKAGISARFHYAPLHESPFGKQYSGDCPVTSIESKCLIRMPIFYGMNFNQIKKISSILQKGLKKLIIK